ncbi:HMA2 domain-containing protein [Metabacillus iocasae]|uniref:Ethanolamine utilization protein EutA (Predicted chaperonin) n=1 Tax=Priestia iocasae TaxID=2291674 RepID=A0ABS2R238_9BACI|nr:hypothetical protein [Metabacillus iocasae]MBM7705061.1 ethanolamine utilization protein EutA (predicted chaperonin) [Metabacillus iocasae]
MLKKAMIAHQLKRWEKEFNRHEVYVKHFIPGRIRLFSPLWKDNESLIKEVRQLIEREHTVMAVKETIETGTILIEFNSQREVQRDELVRWMSILAQKHAPFITP